MKYRALDTNGDTTFGTSTGMLQNSPASVAQAISTRLRLNKGEWFLDKTEGLDLSLILGNNTQGTRDLAVKSRILGTTGVKSITQYSSTMNASRAFTVNAIVDTIYGSTTLTVTL